MLKNHITPTLGLIPVDQLTRDECAAWVNLLAGEKALSGKAIRNIHAVLSGALTWAIDRGMRPDNRNPAYRLRLPRSSRMKEPIFLSVDEIAVLLRTVRPYYRDFVLVALGTGLRFAELAGLRVRDLRDTEEYLEITVAGQWRRGGRQRHTKTTASDNRKIPLEKSVVTEALRKAADGKAYSDLTSSTVSTRSPPRRWRGTKPLAGSAASVVGRSSIVIAAPPPSSGAIGTRRPRAVGLQERVNVLGGEAPLLGDLHSRQALRIPLHVGPGDVEDGATGDAEVLGDLLGTQ
jgi:Phage integrase family